MHPETLLRTLSETIAWCRLTLDLSDPATVLRTPALRPANWGRIPVRNGVPDYDWGSPADRSVPLDALSEMAAARADLLRERNAYPSALPYDLGRGRLLVAVPEQSDQCGLSELESLGYIDVLDVPGWDSWVCHLEETVTARHEVAYSRYTDRWRTGEPYLLCWVPPALLRPVDLGISVNPVECFFWASEYRKRAFETKTLRWLDRSGYLF